MSLLIISPCHYPDESRASLMVASARRHNLQPLLYGVGTAAWSAHGGQEQGVEVIPLLQDRSEDYVLATDCNDVLFLAGEAEIMEKFLALQSKLVVSSESGLHPRNDELYEGLRMRPGHHKYVNIGLWMGERQHAIDTMRCAIERYRYKTPDGLDSPQGWFMWGLLQGTLDFKLDSECVLFQSMAGWAPKHVKVEGGRVHNTATGTTPVAVHFNGNCGGPIPARDELYEALYGRV